MKKKTGISLVVLVITIIVMIIIAGAIIIEVQRTAIIEEARKATFLETYNGLNTALNLKIANMYAKTGIKPTVEEIDAIKVQNLNSDLSQTEAQKFNIQNGTIVLTDNASTEEREILSSLIENNKKLPDENTLLLLHGEEMIDSSPNPIQLTNNNVTLDSTIKKFGNSSLYFNGTNAYIDIENKIGNFKGTNYTIDFWIYPLTCSKGYQGIIDNRNENTDYTGWIFFTQNAAWCNAISDISINNWSIVLSNTNTQINKWIHVAIVRSGSDWYYFLDGKKIMQKSNEKEIDNITSGIRIGTGKRGTYHLTSSSYFNGYLDEIRISNVARWTEEFTPPTEEY